MTSTNFVPCTTVPTKIVSQETCVVVFSGGQDSTTCLGLARKYFANVIAVSVNYGQKHSIELLCAAKICEAYGIQHVILPVDVFTAIGDSNLLAGAGSVNDNHTRLTNLPASFVPNRNAALLTFCHAVAQKFGANYLMTGVCQTDFSGYPDCREDFIQALEHALNIGSQSNISILTPLMHLNKAETWALAQDVGFLEVVRTMSHTCYNGDHEHLHDWGYGCGECPACALRKKGYEAFQASSEQD